MNEMLQESTIYLIPNTLGESNPYAVLPSEIKGTICSIQYYIVENVRNARRFIKKIDPAINIDTLTFFELNKHTKPEEIADFLMPAQNGYPMGIISEAGCPGIADPGSDVVRLAHQKQIKVKPLVGPSSIVLSLMASGLNGQSFAFVGYLPIRQPERSKRIKQLESRVFQENQTQIFIETPYRNNTLLEDMCKTLNDSTLLCVACDLSLETEMIRTQTIATWKKQAIDIDKRPAVFLLGR
jgi:16S rRNA (cytidine1402-2'-O)-methyltransferase